MFGFELAYIDPGSGSLIIQGAIASIVAAAVFFRGQIARLLPGRTLTLFDNRSKLGHKPPRAVRYRINQKRGTATLLRSITDPEVRNSNCCGSARRLPNRDWLISWGKHEPIGGYQPDGKRTFLLAFPSNFSYRAEPAPADALSAPDLRAGMRAMARAPLR